MRHRLAAGVFGLSVLIGPAAEAAPPSRVQAQLVSETESLRPGQPVWVAVVLTMEHGWHTYWSNPGDSGLPTTIRWSLPRGFEVGPIEWPAPVRIDLHDVTSYGYEGQVLLLAKVTPPVDMASGQIVKLAAKVDWLECGEMCLKGGREISLELPVRTEVPQLRADWAEAFSVARARVPHPSDAWDVRPVRRAKKITVSLEFTGDLEPELASVSFFPFEPGVIEHNAPQRLTHGADGYVLELVGSFVTSLKPVERLQGVLIVQEAGEADDMPPPACVQLDVPIELGR